MKAFHESRLYHSTFPFSAAISDSINFLAHWHSDLEFLYVYDGTLRMGVNSEARILHKGDIAICSSGDIHYYDSRDSCSTILLVIFNPQLIGSPGGWPKDTRLASPFIASCEQNSEMDSSIYKKMVGIMQELFRETEQNQKYHELLITGMLFELCGLILRHVPCEPADPKKDKRRIVSMRIMQEVLEYLEANYMRVITLEDAARQANMSLFHFSRFFKSISGMSYTSYLNNIRINQAEKMISTTNKTMIDIALECGFTNVRTFNRVFKQLRAQTPSDLR
ncbi:MAG: AraC family transcriptional regulator [Gorillibacterium sp.]|nr:AraC family transcriptional regulator [Gorillibacterium sp.]